MALGWLASRCNILAHQRDSPNIWFHNEVQCRSFDLMALLSSSQERDTPGDVPNRKEAPTLRFFNFWKSRNVSTGSATPAGQRKFHLKYDSSRVFKVPLQVNRALRRAGTLGRLYAPSRCFAVLFRYAAGLVQGRIQCRISASLAVYKV